MEIPHPRRILLLSAPETPLDSIISTLCPASLPKPSPSNLQPSSQTTSTLTSTSTSQPSQAQHPSPPSSSNQNQNQQERELIHRIKTPYYTASVPVWVDEVPNVQAWAKEWRTMDGAQEVVGAVGAWVWCFRKFAGDRGVEEAALSKTLSTITALIAHHTRSSAAHSYAYDGEPSDALLLAVGLPQTQSPSLDLTSDEYDEICARAGGWEYVDAEAAGGRRNEFGERQGLPRLLEALEAGEWDSGGGGLAGDILDDEDDEVDFDMELDSDVDVDTRAWLRESTEKTAARHEKSARQVPGADLDLQKELDAMLGGLGEEEGTREGLLAKGKGTAGTKKRGLAEDEDGGGGSGEGGVQEMEHRGAKEGAEGEEDGSEGEKDVDDLQHMLSRLQAVRDMGADLPERERKKLAAKAVREVMKGL